jgi:hypothetical protein
MDETPTQRTQQRTRGQPRSNAGTLAANFFDAGFAVIAEGAIPDRHSINTLRKAAARPVRVVILAPPLHVSEQRDRERGGKQVAHHFAHLYPRMRDELHDEGTWIDTTHLTPAQTADEILS